MDKTEILLGFNEEVKSIDVVKAVQNEI